MTIQQIYDLALEMGIDSDPRGKTGVDKFLKRIKKEYEDLSKEKKKYFDSESLTNPYGDTRIFVGDPKIEVKKVLAGIDADAAEVILADRLNQKGLGIDLVIGHHPVGIGLVGLHEVMDLQVDSFANEGVPINVMHTLMMQRQDDVKRKIHPTNHNQIVDTARLLEIPLMNLHTAWDNLGDEFMKKYIAKKTYHTVGDVLDHMMDLPEFQEAARGKNEPAIVSGTPNTRVGKVSVMFTGGTNPSKEIYIELAKAGVGTLIDMHIPEEALKELKKRHINVITAGHMASDSIGANLFLDELESRGIEVIPCSGLIRVNRKVQKK